MNLLFLINLKICLGQARGQGRGQFLLYSFYLGQAIPDCAVRKAAMMCVCVIENMFLNHKS